MMNAVRSSLVTLSSPTLSAQTKSDTAAQKSGRLSSPPVSAGYVLVKLEAQKRATDLIRAGDKALASRHSAALMDQIVAGHVAPDGRSAVNLDIPAVSTFGRAWAQLTNAIHSEPFASFARTHKIDTSTLQLNTQSGWILTCVADGKTVSFSKYDKSFLDATAALTEAANALAPTLKQISYTNAHSAPCEVVSDFYAARTDGTDDGRLKLIALQQQYQSFDALREPGSKAAQFNSPAYAPIREQQTNAIEELSAEISVNPELEPVAQRNPKETVEAADREMARMCASALLSLRPEMAGYGTGPRNHFAASQIPEYSTFGQTLRALMKSISSDAFMRFTAARRIEPDTAKINTFTGDLLCSVRGSDDQVVEKTFKMANDSEWAAIAPSILPHAKSLASGASLDLWLNQEALINLATVNVFYGEPKKADTLEGVLEQASRLTRTGFRALNNDNPPTDPAALRIQEKQRAVIQQLMPEPPLLDGIESAESALAVAMHRVMLEVKADPAQAIGKTMNSVPSDSLFGQWWDYLGKALNGRGFTEWAREQNVDLTSLSYDPSDQALIGKVNGVDQRYTAKDFATKYPGYFDVLTPVLNAAAPFAAAGKPITLPQAVTANAPFKLVCNFYGINPDCTSPAFAQQTELMGRTQRFPTPVEDPDRIVNGLIRQKTALGDSNDRYALVDQLKRVDQNGHHAMRIKIDPDSSHRPKGARTVQEFIRDNSWNDVTSTQQTENLLKALQTPVPQSPALSNLWGFLSTDLPLSVKQRSKVAEFVKDNIGQHDSLWSYLSAGITGLSAQPDKALEQLLSSDKAVEFAAKLEIDMAGLTTTTSLKQWLLTALVLELDPKAGAARNKVADFDFMHSDNWGLHPNEISQRFDKHLIDTSKVSAALAPVASHLLKSGMAPQFVRKDLPSAATLGSSEFAIYTMGVNLVEQIAPGAATGMSGEQITRFIGIDPISADETQQRAMAGMNPVMDWAICNGHVVKSDKDEYTLEQMATAQKALNKQNAEVSAASKFLSTVNAPSRRAMALEALRAKFGSSIDFENEAEWERVWVIFSGVRASIAAVYEAGRLGEKWAPEKPGVDFENLRKHASELPVIKETFNNAIEQDYPQRRDHSISHLKDMLSKLPLRVRVALQNGGMSLYAVGNTGGIVLDLDHYGERHALAFYPGAGKVISIPPIDHSVLHGKAGNLTIDLKAFQTGAEPKPELTPNVVLTPLHLVDPDVWKGGRRFLSAEQAGTTPGNYESIRFQHLAEVLVDTAYLNKANFIKKQRGFNPVDNALKPSDVFLGFMKVVPGGSSILDIYNGDYKKAVYDLGVDIILYAATEGAGKLWTLAKSGASWAAAKVSAKFIEKFGAKEAEDIVLKDLTVNGASQTLLSTSRLQQSHLAELADGKFVQPSNMEDGVVIRSDTPVQNKVTAIFQEGNWYAYDSKTAQAYGPALEGFVSNASSPIQKEIFSDGTSALVTQQSLAADAYTLPRVNGFDLVNEGKVYRYDTRHPGVLTDLESADHFKPLEGFEAICHAPTGLTGRFRRGANDTCFSKVINTVSSELTQELQALEHVRLFPSAPKLFRKDQFVIFERRRFKLVEGEMGPQLNPVLDNKRITYKDTVTGTLKEDPQFGFHSTQTNDALARESRVVKLNSISAGCDDKRELRGIVVKDLIAGSNNQYLVIEADIGEFYAAKLNGAPGAELTFTKCTHKEFPLVRSYKARLNIRQGVAGVPLDNNFIALPKLDKAFQELERTYKKPEVDELRAYCKEMSAEQQREVLYQLQRLNQIGKADIALKPIQVSALDKPTEFATWTAEQQNKFYAQNAKSDVNRGMKATGLGPGNQVLTKADKARAEAASQTIGWIRRTAANHAPNRANLVLKTGAGNCGEMALVCKDIIDKSGGRAYEWHASDAHAFTVVGGPSTLPPGTVNFSEPAWKDAWIVDPWTDIACPAREYTQKLKEVMTQWERKNIRILEGEESLSPLDDHWIEDLITKSKTPFSHGYNRT